MSRNSSRAQLDNNHEDDSEDLTKARDKAPLKKDDLKAEREALKKDIMRMKGGKNSGGNSNYSESEDILANTHDSNFSIALGKLFPKALCLTKLM